MGISAWWKRFFERWIAAPEPWEDTVRKRIAAKALEPQTKWDGEPLVTADGTVYGHAFPQHGGIQVIGLDGQPQPLADYHASLIALGIVDDLVLVTGVGGPRYVPEKFKPPAPTAEQIHDDIAEALKEVSGPKMAKRMLTGEKCPWDDCIFPDCNWRMGCPRITIPDARPPPEDPWRNTP